MSTNVQKKSNINSFKRRLVSEKECLFDLKNELQTLFDAFYNAHSLFEKEIIQTPPESRARCFEASLLNSKMIQSIQKYFPNNWKFGKYKRFTLQVNGYIILFKKLNKKGMPMNIKTKAVSAIADQLQFSLFDDKSYVAEPIVFFGYQKGKFGNIINPKLTYIDENKIKWVITESQLPRTEEVGVPITPMKPIVATPKLKETPGDASIAK